MVFMTTGMTSSTPTDPHIMLERRDARRGSLAGPLGHERLRERLDRRRDSRSGGKTVVHWADVDVAYCKIGSKNEVQVVQQTVTLAHFSRNYASYN